MVFVYLSWLINLNACRITHTILAIAIYVIFSLLSLCFVSISYAKLSSERKMVCVYFSPPCINNKLSIENTSVSVSADYVDGLIWKMSV